MQRRHNIISDHLVLFQLIICHALFNLNYPVVFIAVFYSIVLVYCMYCGSCFHISVYLYIAVIPFWRNRGIIPIVAQYTAEVVEQTRKLYDTKRCESNNLTACSQLNSLPNGIKQKLIKRK